MRAAGLLVLLAALGLLPRARAAESEAQVVLEGHGAVHEVLREDLDRDGVKDLLVVEGRTIYLWKGRRDALPLAPATRIGLPPGVSAVDVAGRNELLAFGTAGPVRVFVGEDGSSLSEGSLRIGVLEIPWVDHVRANFVDLVRGDRLVVPSPEGWVISDLEGREHHLFALERDRVVTAPGPFLEDSAKVEDGIPDVVMGAPLVPGGPPSLWALSGGRLLGQAGAHRVAYDVSFLPASGERRLVDMDGDGVPDVVHGEGTNSEQRVAFFRTPPPVVGADGVPAATGSLKPPVAYLQLTGYPLDPQTVDLDGDGRRDFVLTSIEIDTANIVRALAGGKVTAHTRAFRNRRGAPGERLLPNEPDTVITSDIGVRIRFGYTGNIDIQRSFTIAVDGDYDGDGRLDLAIREGFDAIRVRRGTAEGVWEPEGRRVAIPPMGDHPDLDAYPADLTGDRKDELVLVYRAPPGGRDRIVVLRPGS